MITCKECKHWDKLLGGAGVRGFCDCKKIIVSRDGPRGNPKEIMWVWQTGGGNAYIEFSTGQDFGCIHGKEKK